MGGTAGTGAKTKAVILGGGAAGVAAAFWLTSTATLRAQYDVTLYSRGWRLGGKCASGRNAQTAQRIEEHGLHILMGCYNNAFRTIRACYEECQPPQQSPIQSFADAFLPQREVVLEKRDGGAATDGWAPWIFRFAKSPGEPGDALTAQFVAAPADQEQQGYAGAMACAPSG